MFFFKQACLVIFTTYVFISEENVLNADTIFFTVAIVNVMKYPLSMLSLAIGRFAEVCVLINIFENYLKTYICTFYVTHNIKLFLEIIFLC